MAEQEVLGRDGDVRLELTQPESGRVLKLEQVALRPVDRGVDGSVEHSCQGVNARVV